MVNLNHDERKNIWIAASDGDLDRVKEIVESGISPMIADENTYTPLHAAVSWNQLNVLDYLISKGGDINITDEDGDTPLFSVEDLETAKHVIELGGNPTHLNQSGLTAADHLEEDFPEISNYLRTLTERVRDIMTDAESRGVTENDPEVNERLRQIVTETVEGSVGIGRLIGSNGNVNGFDLPPSMGANNLETVLEGEEVEEDQVRGFR
ncbi:ankyrin repeat-containing domain protein [Melampsora americana]|nr:ankyrin repeat-containing domain protein [Melampsora americana]